MRLLADIGGTNARFALAEPDGMPVEERHLLVRDFAEPSDAIDAYLGDRKVTEAVIAVATPIERRRSPLHQQPLGVLDRGPAPPARTSSSWPSSTISWRRHWRCRTSPPMRSSRWAAVPACPAGRSACLGPGTGLGVSALIPSRGRLDRVPHRGRPCLVRARRMRASRRCSITCASASAMSPTSGCCPVRASSTSPRRWRRWTAGPAPPRSPEEVSDAAADEQCPSCREAVAHVQRHPRRRRGQSGAGLRRPGRRVRCRRHLPSARAPVRPRRLPTPVRRQGPHAPLCRADPDLARPAARYRPDRRCALPRAD